MAIRPADADDRIRRARALADSHPQAAQPLTFYAALTELQRSIVQANPSVVRPAVPRADALDFEAAADALPGLLTGLRTIAPAPLAAAADALLRESHAEWRHLLHTWWRGERDGEPHRSFIAEALLHPYAEAIARGTDADHTSGDAGGTCRVCGDLPVVAVLREEAHGARRSVICGLCLTEWPAPRVGCLHCGEAQFDKLAVYRADDFPGVRVDACETCREYVKTIDLTKDATAIPVVDDIASVALDLWAREQGYRRIRPNLLRL